MYKGKYVTAIVLARAESSRLKHKMLLPFLEFETVFEAVLHRVFKCNLIDEIIFATSKNPLDDKLVEIAIKRKISGLLISNCMQIKAPNEKPITQLSFELGLFLCT